MARYGRYRKATEEALQRKLIRSIVYSTFIPGTQLEHEKNCRSIELLERRVRLYYRPIPTR